MKNYLVLYGSLTGNCEILATSAYTFLLHQGHKVDLVSQATFEFENLYNYTHAIVCGSTWHEGAPNPDTESFIDSLNSFELDVKKCPKVYVFGLGDSAYGPTFCLVTDHIAATFAKHNVKVCGTQLQLDGMPDERMENELTSWIKNVVLA